MNACASGLDTFLWFFSFYQAYQDGVLSGDDAVCLLWDAYHCLGGYLCSTKL